MATTHAPHELFLSHCPGCGDCYYGQFREEQWAKATQTLGIKPYSINTDWGVTELDTTDRTSDAIFPRYHVCPNCPTPINDELQDILNGFLCQDSYGEPTLP